MMIFTAGEPHYETLSPSDMQQRLSLWQAWIEDLKAKNIYVDGRALKSQRFLAESADGILTDGPFVEAKELVSGFFVVKAVDYEAAAEISRGFPDYDLGAKVMISEIETFSDYQ
ncbi:MAG: YciI family protein [Bacteroidota bacterium]